MPENVIDQYTQREKLKVLLVQAELDPQGRGEEIKADPVAALTNLGFSSDDANQLLTGAAASSAPAGVGSLASACADTTCGISLCPSTCFATIPGIPGLCSGNCTWFSW